jgi:hypothetical protein
MRPLLLILLLSLAASSAVAAEPDFVWEDNGTLRATVVFEAPLAAVKKLLADPVKAMSLSPDVKKVTATAKGACHEVHVTTTGITDSFQYHALRCPTEAGVKDELISSEDYEVQNSEWVLTAVDGGTRGVLRTRTKLTAWVPERFVKSGVKKGISKMIAAMQGALARD